MSNFIKNAISGLRINKKAAADASGPFFENQASSSEKSSDLSPLSPKPLPRHRQRRIWLFFILAFFFIFFFSPSVAILTRAMGLLVLLAIGTVVYRRRPKWAQKLILSLQAKRSFLWQRTKQIYKRISQKVVNWFSRFKLASNQERWAMARKPLLIFIALFLVLEFGDLFLPPRITTSFPGNQDAEVPLDSRIEIIFDRGVIKSLAEKSFSIQPEVKGQFSWEGDQKLIFEPENQLDRASGYQITFGGPVLSKFLIPLIGSKTISFETIGNPKVILASPQNEALEDLTPITVVFDRPMIALTTAANSAIKQPAFTVDPEIKGEGRWLGTTAYQFRPSEPFKKATTYKVTVPAGMRSQDEGVLQEEYGWEFSSERPQVISVRPLADYDFASPAASVSATFNQDIDPASIDNKFAVYDQNENKAPGRVAVVDNVVSFYPSQPFRREERYTAVLSQGVRSIEGANGLEADYPWSFRIAAEPAVIGSTPADGDKDVSEEYSIKVLFKTPMDEESFKGNVFIDPQPEAEPDLYFSSYSFQNSLLINTYLARSKTYTITIGAAVKDQYGVPLGNPYTFKFTTASYEPSISIYPTGTYFGAFNQEVIPRIVARVINASRVDYSLYRLGREEFLDLYRRRYGEQCPNDDMACRNWQSYDPSRLEKIHSWSETYEADFNTPVHVVTKVTTDSGGKIPPGFYFLEVRIPQGAHDNMVMIVSRSALTVKKSDEQIFSWAVNQSTSEVISGMKMQLTDSSGNVLSQGESNNDGVFVKDVDLFHKNDLFVFGQKDDDMVVAASAWSEGINWYDFGLPSYYNVSESKDYYSKRDYKLFLTLDRPIYRPGQKVYFKGVIKKDNDGDYENLQPGERVELEIIDAQNRSVYRENLPITTFGSFAGEFVLSKDANLGDYQIKATFSGNSYSQKFQVEEYKKPDLAVSVESLKEAYLQGDNAEIAISASYYFGDPVVDAPVTWVLQTQDYFFRWDKDWRFEFGDPDSYWSRPWWYYSGSSYFSGEKITEGKGRTDAKGNLELSLPLDISKKETSQQMIIEATVNDINNQSIAASREFIVYKSGLYVGLRPVSYANQAGKETSVEVVTVDPKGNEVSGTPVALKFYKRTWKTVREKNPDDGLFYYTSKPSDSLVASVAVVTDSLGRATASFVPQEGGTYKVVGRVTDKNGNQNESGSFLWVSGPGFSTARENNDRIVVVTDKRDYLVGENLSFFVASPFASESAKTLLTVERGSVLDYKVVDTNESSNNFTMPVLPKYAPNAFVGAVLVRGGNEVKKPAEFKIGYTEIKVTDKKQQIEVQITTDKKKYKPKETLKATIQAKDLLGYPVSAELAVGLVDKAVWDLANIELPDIYQTFYQPRNLGVSTSQLLTISIDRVNANTNLGSKGGSGGGCFTGDTLVLMKGKTYKKIQDIKAGDMVLTRGNENLPKLVEAKVTKTYKHEVDRYLIINGELKVTPAHRLFVNGQWLTAGEVEVGDYLLDKNNQPVRVFSVEQVWGDFNVYNLEIEKYKTYFAGDIYVHNQKGAATLRTDFQDTAYWNPAIKTDSEGKAEIEIPLPDNLTTWRLAAVANSQEAAFGSGTTEVSVSRDVLIRPFLPRFLAVGDEAKLGAIIVNSSGEEQSLRVKIEAEGLQVNEEQKKEIVLADGAQKKVTWATVAKNIPLAKIKLVVESKDENVKDAMETTLPIKLYSVPEVVATSGQAKDIASEKIILPQELDPTQGGAEVSFSPSLGGQSVNALPYLFTYPYYCTEQIASRFMPAVFVHRLLVNARIEKSGSIEIKQLEGVINDGIQRLNNQQHSDGGWGWWMEEESIPFLTAYAYLALFEAKNDGFTVADQTLERAQGYLEEKIAKDGQKIPLDTQAYILYVLRRTKANLSSYAANLFERHFELSLEGRAYLAMAMKEMPGMEERAKRLHDELLSLAKKTATTTHWEEPRRNDYFFGSNITTTASILEMITLFNKNNPLVPEVVRHLMSARADDHWSTTRETAAVIKAISTQLLYKEDQKVNEDYRLELNGQLLKEGKFTKADLLGLQEYAISISDFNIGGENDLKITKNGEGNLYYNVNLKYYLPFSEVEPLEQGMVVVREFVDNKGNILPADTIGENTEVWVRLIIVAPEERRLVVIEDTLPAGLESVNESLKNVSILNKERPNLKEEGNRLLYFAHKEYHDDRTALFASYLPAGVYEVMYRVRATTPGKYHHPPAQAYQMYVPDVSGHSAGGWLEVK
ncbi:Ig-like domain-containing protein [Candidatus Shapirobacteria bacterium]|nr:Ig-like domain-containing protein [Candidatus Shapirobacteria bacterium]